MKLFGPHSATIIVQSRDEDGFQDLSYRALSGIDGRRDADMIPQVLTEVDHVVDENMHATSGAAFLAVHDFRTSPEGLSSTFSDVSEGPETGDGSGSMTLPVFSAVGGFVSLVAKFSIPWKAGVVYYEVIQNY